MTKSRSGPKGDWKAIVLTSSDWPKDLTIPQEDKLPKDSECIQDSMCCNEHWDWELWRHPDGHCYYLKAWPKSDPHADFGQSKTPGAVLTVMETFRFLMVNWMPRDVIADLIFEHPEFLQSLNLPRDSHSQN